MRKYLILIALVCLAVIPIGAAAVTDKQPHAAAETAKTETAADDLPSSPAYIAKIFTMGGTTYVKLDYIQWYQGSEADRVFREREQDPEMTEAPDGYYIVNDDPTLHTYAVVDDAEVFMQIYNRSGSWDDADIQADERITLRKFRSLFTKDNEEIMSSFPYRVTIANGKVVKIVQQFIP
ncbi:hypothetical protein [Cohnella nanjingensis]|uniref:DUF4309 domain-containing protein n=1 Tax=Cohnella nanjingensis TaxID=1387779 RepID=A0A7X0VI19_9BACL|nr:hypothetical protein [Cohnella nanjingensis]MBB6674740.1 hypothetical protein [Cohnella nanjingensis]